MVDNVTIQIEVMAAKCGSFKEAFLDFAEMNGIYDYEDLLATISKNLYNKIKNEFIEKNYFPEKRQENILDLF